MDRTNKALLAFAVVWVVLTYVIAPMWLKPSITEAEVALVDAHRERPAPTVFEGRTYRAQVTDAGRTEELIYRFRPDGQLFKAVEVNGEVELAGTTAYRFDGAVMVFDQEAIVGAKRLFPPLGEPVASISETELVLPISTPDGAIERRLTHSVGGDDVELATVEVSVASPMSDQAWWWFVQLPLTIALGAMAVLGGKTLLMRSRHGAMWS